MDKCIAFVIRIFRLSALTTGLLLISSAQAASNTYRVLRDQNLSEISVLLYGNTNRMKSLAELNDLKPPQYPLHEGQMLKLPLPAIVSEKEGNDTLVMMWGRKLDRKNNSSEASEEISAPAQALNPNYEVHTLAPSTQENTPRVDQADALKTFSEFKEKEEPNSVEVDYAKASQAFEAGKITEAQHRYQRIRERDPSHLPSWLGELRAARAGSDRKQSEALACEFAQRFPQLKALPFIASSLPVECPSTQGGSR